MIRTKTDIPATTQNIPEDIGPNQYPVQVESQEGTVYRQCITGRIGPKGIDQLEGIQTCRSEKESDADRIALGQDHHAQVLRHKEGIPPHIGVSEGDIQTNRNYSEQNKERSVNIYTLPA